MSLARQKISWVEHPIPSPLNSHQKRTLTGFCAQITTLRSQFGIKHSA
jgi:hypothetical protein